VVQGKGQGRQRPVSGRIAAATAPPRKRREDLSEIQAAGDVFVLDNRVEVVGDEIAVGRRPKNGDRKAEQGEPEKRQRRTTRPVE